MIVCPKCGAPAVYDPYAEIAICSSSFCNWTGSLKNDEVHMAYKAKMNESKTEIPIKYYIEFFNEESEIIQANSLYELIKEMLKRIGEFTPFVEKCYCSFLKSSIYELVEFYNHFSEFTITKISKFDNFNCIYEKESLDT